MQAFGGECDYQGRIAKAPPICDVGCCTATCDPKMQRCWNLPVVPFYWDNLWKDPAFLNGMKCRWLDLRKGPIRMQAIDERIDEWKKQLAPLAMPRHLAKWPELLKSVWANPYKVDPTSAPDPGRDQRRVLRARGHLVAQLDRRPHQLPGRRPPRHLHPLTGRLTNATTSNLGSAPAPLRQAPLPWR